MKLVELVLFVCVCYMILCVRFDVKKFSYDIIFFFLSEKNEGSKMGFMKVIKIFEIFEKLEVIFNWRF